MGLDMFLTGERYLWSNETDLKSLIGSNLKLPEGVNVRDVVVDMGYWRKANAIHRWFVTNVQDGNDACQRSPISEDDLSALLSACMQVKADHTLAPSLLPTQSGFFFGETEYNDVYFNDIDDTIEILERVLKLGEQQKSLWVFYYQASW